MKVNEVPQDKGYLVKGRVTDLNYAVDENGNYTTMQSEGWQPKNEAMTLAWEVVYEKAQEVRQKVLDGILSPVAFYMELNVMDVKILSDYTGIPKWKVRRHLKMKNFTKLNSNIISRYADAFKLIPSDLSDLNKIREAKPGHED